MYENVTEVIRSKPSNQMQGTVSKISNQHLKQRKRPSPIAVYWLLIDFDKSCCEFFYINSPKPKESVIYISNPYCNRKHVTDQIRIQEEGLKLQLPSKLKHCYRTYFFAVCVHVGHTDGFGKFDFTCWPHLWICSNVRGFGLFVN